MVINGQECEMVSYTDRREIMGVVKRGGLPHTTIKAGRGAG